MEIKLIALDLDGTLLNSKKQASERTLNALRAAAAQGIHIVPTTGRMFGAMPKEVLACEFIRYGICMNGGQIYDSKEDRVLHRDEIPLELAMRVYDYLDEISEVYDCYVNNSAVMGRAFWEQLDQILAGKPLDLAYSKGIRTPVEDFRGYLRKLGMDLQKMQVFMADVSGRPAIMETLRTRFPELAVTYSLPYNIEMNTATATKGAALRILCDHLGIPVAQAAAFGDGTNDISMLEAAGVGVAMANAVPEAKAAANHETVSNDEDGVAVFLEKYVLK